MDSSGKYDARSYKAIKGAEVLTTAVDSIKYMLRNEISFAVMKALPEIRHGSIYEDVRLFVHHLRC